LSIGRHNFDRLPIPYILETPLSTATIPIRFSHCPPIFDSISGRADDAAGEATFSGLISGVSADSWAETVWMPAIFSRCLTRAASEAIARSMS
jgi:hypothetical protein